MCIPLKFAIPLVLSGGLASKGWILTTLQMIYLHFLQVTTFSTGYEIHLWLSSGYICRNVVLLSKKVLYYKYRGIILLLSSSLSSFVLGLFFLIWRDSPQRARACSFTTHHTVGLLWTSDQLVAETSTWQHTTLTTDIHPCPWYDSNPQSQQANDSKLTP